MTDWILRFVKGLFIGSGFILPGVSGGALAAVFGIYERIILFLAHITRDFKKQFLFLFPVGLGALTGIFLLSFAVSFFLGTYEVQILWFFVGCILGTVPALWEQTGRKGRQSRHYVILAVSFFASLFFLISGEALFQGQIAQNFSTWILAGALIGLGALVPGLSPSNFLVYMGMYKDMSDGIKSLDFMLILPVMIGCVGCVLLLSKVMEYIFKKAYTGLFHTILGIVFASTIMIIPRDFNYLSLGTLVCLLMCFAGIALGYWMSMLEKKYKPAD